MRYLIWSSNPALGTFWASKKCHSGPPILGWAAWTSSCRLCGAVRVSEQEFEYPGRGRIVKDERQACAGWPTPSLTEFCQGPRDLTGYPEVLGARQVTGMGSLSVLSQTLPEAVRSCLKSVPESSLELSGSRDCQPLVPQQKQNVWHRMWETLRSLINHHCQAFFTSVKI